MSALPWIVNREAGSGAAQPRADGPTVLLANPCARRVDREAARHVAFALGLEGGAIREIGADGSARQLAREAVRAGAWCVAVAGGDGTLHEIAQELVDTPTALGVIPLGTSNDLAKRLGIPLDLAEAARVLEAGVARSVDVLNVNGRRVLTAGGVGFPALVARDCNVLRATPFGRRLAEPLGGAIYSAAAAARLMMKGPRPQRLDFLCGNASGSLLLTAVLFGVVQHFGGGIHLSPEGPIAPGRFAALAVTSRTRLQTLATLLRLRRGLAAPATSHAFPNVTSLVVRTEQPVPVFGDGEWLGMRQGVRVTVERRALRVVLPFRSLWREAF